MARVLGMSEVTLYRAIHAGQFPAVKIRGRFTVPAKVLDLMESDALSSWSMVDSASYVSPSDEPHVLALSAGSR